MPIIIVNRTGLFATLFGEAAITAGSTNLLALNVTAGAVLPASTLQFVGQTIKVFRRLFKQ